MERLGLDDDVAIESRLVSKTIESAQSRVEGFNFDIRKRVVEYDDVINKQRETIYAERDKVLRNEDLTETIRAFLDDDLREIVERHLGEPSDPVTEDGLTVIEIAPGVDLEKDVLAKACVPLLVSPDLQLMSSALFRPESMGLILSRKPSRIAQFIREPVPAPERPGPNGQSAP